MWLACYTEEEIAKQIGVGPRTVPNVVKSAENAIWQKLRIFSEYRDPDWSPPLYDVWIAIGLG
jgi:predicted transcriptional regulator